jgi:hypothetical protein
MITHSEFFFAVRDSVELLILLAFVWLYWRYHYELWWPDLRKRFMAQPTARDAEEEPVSVGQAQRLADGTVCSHQGETSDYCTRCWAPLKPGVGA